MDENYRQTLVLGISKENLLGIPDSLMYFLNFDFDFFCTKLLNTCQNWIQNNHWYGSNGECFDDVKEMFSLNCCKLHVMTF